jgi:hypothetical protein
MTWRHGSIALQRSLCLLVHATKILAHMPWAISDLLHDVYVSSTSAGTGYEQGERMASVSILDARSRSDFSQSRLTGD